jgi:SET domain-containing protein
VRLPQAWKRVEQSDKIYLVELNPRQALDCSQGNALKHLNHSCAPTCYLRIWQNRIEVYALRDLQPGEELTVDYGVTPHRGGMVCQCGAPGCRGRL